MGIKNEGKKQAGSPTITILAVAAAIIVLAIIFVLPLVPVSSSGANGLSPVSNIMSEEGCAAVYGVLTDGICPDGFSSIAEVNSKAGVKRFCCGRISNPDQAAKAPLPITPPQNATLPGESKIPEVS